MKHTLASLLVLWSLQAPRLAPAASVDLSPRVPAVVDAPLPGDLMQATVHRLKNGLTVYLSPNHERPRITAWIATRTGSKMDPHDCTGLAHYLEHMLFKGTHRLGTLNDAGEQKPLARISALYEQRFKTTDPAERARLAKEIDKENLAASKFEIPNELDKLYNQLGFNNLNAFTMNEGTVFVCDLPRNRFDVWTRLESDRFVHPVFRLFQTELEAVYEEKNRATDDPDEAFGEAMGLAMFPQHPYGTQPTLGTVEHLKNPSLNRMYAYCAARYRPNNMCIALAGDFDPAPTLKLLEQRFGGWVPAALPVDGPWPVPAPTGTVRVNVNFESEEKVQIAWLTVAQGDPDADALTVADMLMDNSATGILNLTLNQQQKVKSSGSYPEMLNEAGTWNTWGVPKKGQTLAEVEGLLLAAVDTLKAGTFTDDEMKAVITNFEVSEKRALESDEARVNRMAFSFLANEEWERAAHKIDRLRKVRHDDVVHVARRYFGSNRVIGYRHNAKPELPSIQKPGFTPVEIDASRQSAFFRELASLPATPIQPKWLVAGKDYQVSDRPFGRLYATANPQNDVFTLGIGIIGGADEHRELAAAMSLLDKSGAGSLSAEQFKKTLYALGSSISMSVDSRWTYISVTGLESHLDETLHLLFDRFAHPVIEPGTLAKQVEVAIGSHQDNKKDPDYVFHALNEYAQRGKESHVLRQLSDAEERSLNQSALVTLARGLWNAKQDVQYVGTLTPDEFAARYAAAGFPATNAASPRKPETLAPFTANRVMFTHREMVQSKAFVWAPDGVLNPAHAVDEEFYSSYLGGSMSSVIFQEIREARGLAYSAWGGYESGHWAGDANKIAGFVGTQADKTVEATALLQSIMHKPPLDARRFTETKQSVLEGYRGNPIHFRDIPSSVLRWEEEGITGGDPRPARFARAQAYTLKDLGAFANRFPTTPFTFVVLGNKARVAPDSLKPFGAVEEVPVDALFPY